MTGKRRAGRPGQSPAPPPVAVGTQVIAPRKTRRELRTERRRQRRRRIGVAGIAAIVVGVLIVGAAIGFGVHSATSGSSAPADPETTLLVTLQGNDGTAVASMFAAHDVKGKQGLELLVPSRLLTDVCGFGTQQFGQIIALPQGIKLSQQAMSQLLGGVTVDGSWVMSTDQLSRLVDAVGGVTADVDVDVARPQPGGTTRVVVPAGKGQRLGGAAAVAFATYQAPGEDATAVLSRFQKVFQAVADRLPAKSDAAGRVLTAAGVHSSLPSSQFASLLVALAHDDATNALLPEDLPTKSIDSGGGAASYRVDPAGVAPLVQSHLAASLPESAQQRHKTVFVENGVGTSGLVGSACNRLLPAGYGFAGSGNAPNFKYKTSQVIVFDSTVAAARLGDDVARLLRLPQGDVVASTQGQNVADVVVILGHDYKP